MATTQVDEWHLAQKTQMKHSINWIAAEDYHPTMQPAVSRSKQLNVAHATVWPPLFRKDKQAKKFDKSLHFAEW